MSLMPDSATERTTTVVIGAGLSGLAVASELSRYGVGSIVVDGFGPLAQTGPSVHTGMLQRCEVAGILLADHVVVTRCAQSQLRKMLAELGIAVGQNLVAAMRAVGMHLVGVGELITPTPKEVLRQAKAVGQAISSKVALPAAPGLAIA